MRRGACGWQRHWRSGPERRCDMWTNATRRPRLCAASSEMGGSTRGRKGDVDSMAAAMLLQHALQLPEDANENRRAHDRSLGAMQWPGCCCGDRTEHRCA